MAPFSLSFIKSKKTMSALKLNLDLPTLRSLIGEEVILDISQQLAQRFQQEELKPQIITAIESKTSKSVEEIANNILYGCSNPSWNQPLKDSVKKRITEVVNATIETYIETTIPAFINAKFDIAVEQAVKSQVASLTAKHFYNVVKEIANKE